MGARFFLVLFLLAILVFVALPVRAEQPIAITASAGAFSVFDDGEIYETGWEASFKPRRFRFAPRFVRKLSPTLGAMATSQGTLYVYGGFRYDVPLGEVWRVSPQWAAGLYYHDNGRDLGGPIEFRSGLELSRRVGERGRLGLLLYHLSNGRIYSRNPGGESLVLTYSSRP